MDADTVARWMLSQLEKDGCIYQDDTVDFLIKSESELLLRENNDGNQVLSKSVLDAFRKLTEVDVIWVKPDRYWRYRVAEDEPGRDQRG